MFIDICQLISPHLFLSLSLCSNISFSLHKHTQNAVLTYLVRGSTGLERASFCIFGPQVYVAHYLPQNITDSIKLSQAN